GRDPLLSKQGSYHESGLVDPEGRRFIAPLKQKTVVAEEELRREAAEISRLLNPHKIAVPYSAWLWSFFGCSLVVLSGILPALILPANSSEYLQTQEGKNNLNLLLSFAVGSLLGDVFLHLLPETWNNLDVDVDQIGFCTLGGLLICFFIEKLCSTTEESQHRICAIMNLCANLVDNFTHGLAVGASFLVSPKFGMMTTFAILVHEIPHEVSDFAILLRADFKKMDAVKAQLVTASGGVLGACVALHLRTDDVQSPDWILPFTAGGFINIALAQILPELSRETDRKQNIRQLLMILLGVGVMVAVSHFHMV
ncbi:metal cation transporter, ZIP family, partial [Necator americanus]